MIEATLATAISDLVRDGGYPPAVPPTTREGNTLLDEMNMAVVHACMRGNKSTYLAVQKYHPTVIANSIETIEMLGYTVDQSRLRSYKELVVTWS